MKKALLFFGIISFLLSFPVWAAPYLLTYSLKPGEKWSATIQSQTEIRSQGRKELIRSKTLIEYQVQEKIDQDWVSILARVRSRTDYTGRGPQSDEYLYQTLFMAHMHSSGELRNIAYQPGNSAFHPPALRRFPAGSTVQETGLINDFFEQWQDTVFWFPVFPLSALKPGDSFEIIQKRFIAGPDNQWNSRGLSKQIFTLESVGDGQARFNVQDRAMSTAGAGYGSNTGTRSLTKTRAVFDMRQGMWVEWTSQFRAQELLNPGASGSAIIRDIRNITKYEIRK